MPYKLDKHQDVLWHILMHIGAFKQCIAQMRPKTAFNSINNIKKTVNVSCTHNLLFVFHTFEQDM